MGITSPKPVKGKGRKVYPSIMAAARALKVDDATIRRHLRKFGDVSRVNGPRQGCPIRDAEGKVYVSRCEAARKLGVHHRTVEWHLDKYGDLSRVSARKKPTRFGVEYPSKEAAAKALGVKLRTIHDHMGKHGNLDRVGAKAGRRWARTTRIGPAVFASRAEAAAALGISHPTLRAWTSPEATKDQRTKLVERVIAYKMKESGSVSQMSD